MDLGLGIMGLGFRDYIVLGLGIVGLGLRGYGFG